MSDRTIDDVDAAILYALQEDARNTASGDIASRTGISDSTVRKRIGRLETDGVIKGYGVEVDYQRSGYPLRMLLYCTAPIPERGEHVDDILAIDGVVSVQELVSDGRHQEVLLAGDGRRRIGQRYHAGRTGVTRHGAHRRRRGARSEPRDDAIRRLRPGETRSR